MTTLVLLILIGQYPDPPSNAAPPPAAPSKSVHPSPQHHHHQPVVPVDVPSAPQVYTVECQAVPVVYVPVDACVVQRVGWYPRRVKFKQIFRVRRGLFGGCG